MSALEFKSRQSRQAILTAVLFVVLLLSVGVAWALVQVRTADIRHGEAIVRQIGEQGLDTWWPENLEDWYLVQQGNRTSWAYRAAVRREDGSYVGLHVMGSGVWEGWLLQGDALAGLYRAGNMAHGQDTQIVLENDFIHAIQHQHPRAPTRESQAPRPENYLAEGAAELAYYLTIRSGRTAKFSIIVNESVPIGQHTSFVPVTIEPAGTVGEGPFEGMLAARARFRDVREDHLTLTYYFSPQGRLAGWEGPGMQAVRTGGQEVIARFPQAPNLVQGIGLGLEFFTRPGAGAADDSPQPPSPQDPPAE